jgi:hypothetical protein
MNFTSNPNNPQNVRLGLSADTSGCPIECLPDLIRKRAYQLFENRGCHPGYELDDWLQAEREIKKHLGI